MHEYLTSEVLAKWQSIVDLMADAVSMPAGFIVRYDNSGYEIVISSKGELNPYKAGAVIPSETNIFCKKVISECRPQVVTSATTQEEWQDNPEVRDDGFNTYVGYPIHKVDGSVYGTICVMDFESHPVNKTHHRLVEHFRDVAELDLKILDKLHSATDLSLKDDLTGLYNRRGFNLLLQKQFFFGRRAGQKITFMIADIDKLKGINDRYGHKIGDRAIITMANALVHSSRNSDLVARVGGDEFYLAINCNDQSEIEKIVARAEAYLKDHRIESGAIGFSYGTSSISCSSVATLNTDSMIEEADRKLYRRKNNKH